MKLKILLYGFLFMSFALSCNKTVVEPLESTQNQHKTTKLKSATIGTYFVSPTGSNKNPGTESQPFLTAAYAASLTKPGDIVIFEDGIYTGTPGKFFATISRSGTSSNYITYRARNKGGAILDGQDNSALAAFSIPGGTSYINISGFNIKGMKGVGIEVRNGASHLNFSDLSINDIGRGCYENSDGRSGFSIGNSSEIVIERCLIHDIGAYAPGENGCSYSSSWIGYQTQDHGIYVSGSSHLTIKNNVFYNCSRGFGVQIYSGNGKPSSYVNIINNTFENGNPYQKASHIILWNNISNSLIANNIFKDYSSYAIYIYQGSYAYSNIAITKNITSGGKGILSVGTAASGVTISDNYTTSDLLFTNETTHDYSLKSNSPAAIKGYNTGLTTDYLNNARTTINIGAYGSLSSAPAPAPSTTTTTYYNTQTSATATKNDCGTGYSGSSVTYTVAANKYSSTLSQADADDEATADLNANKQTYANENGNCTNAETTVYYNIKITGTATKNDCGEGYVGSRINYVVSANTYSSMVSQGDADAQAIAYVDAQKQRNANEHGYCRPIR